VADTFSILARQLSTAERKHLLSRIMAAGVREEPQEPDAETPREPPPQSVDSEYAGLSFLGKLILLIKSFFTRKSTYELTEQLILRRIRWDIEASAPGLIDFRAEAFTAKMRAEMEAVRPSLSFFRAVLDGTAKQRDFIAFLTGIELAPLNEQIMAETDPRAIFQEPFLAEERAIRSEMWDRFDRLLAGIPPDRKANAYRDMRRLHAFEALASLRIEDSIALFPKEGGGPRLFELEARLMQLCDTMAAVADPPSPVAWSALFLFRSSEALEDPDFDMEKGCTAFIARAAAARRAILDFAHGVNLTKIVRYILKDISYVPNEPGGGEEWFVLFRSFWEDRMEEVLRRFSQDRRKQACVIEALEFFGLPRLAYLENYRSGRYGDHFAPRHETSLAIVRAFYESVFQPKMDRYLKILNINGDFYKEENRAAFADCYEKLVGAREKLTELDRRLSAGSDLGARIAELAAESSSLESRGKLGSLANEANLEARKIVDTVYSTLNQLSRILFGLLFGEAGGPYDSITNLNTIGGRENRLILKGLDDAIHSIDRVAALLAAVRDVEMG
jgi:hypothetical protein